MRTTSRILAEPGGRTWSRLFMAAMIAAAILVSAGLGARVTGMVAAGAAHRASASAAQDLAEMQTRRTVAEGKAQACFTAFGHDRAALQEMALSASDLNNALKTASTSGWADALALVGSATAHLQASKIAIAQANAANCTE
jgi:hypothetical protein